jgi:DNA-binding CsgD family transcriptional regulator
MSRSAKRTVLHLPMPHCKSGTSKTNSLLDIRLNIRELNNDLEVNIKVNKLQFFDFARYIFEMSLMKQFLLSYGENELCNNSSSVKNQDKSSLNKIYRLNALSDRQRQIFEKLLMGMNNEEIAKEMHLAESTVKGHLQEVYLKLGVLNRYFAIIQYKDTYYEMKKLARKK